MTQTTDLAPFDPDFDADNPFITDVPERFVSFSEDEDIEREAHTAWGEWFEAIFDPDTAFIR